MEQKKETEKPDEPDEPTKSAAASRTENDSIVYDKKKEIDETLNKEQRLAAHMHASDNGNVAQVLESRPMKGQNGTFAPYNQQPQPKIQQMPIPTITFGKCCGGDFGAQDNNSWRKSTPSSLPYGKPFVWGGTFGDGKRGVRRGGAGGNY